MIDSPTAPERTTEQRMTALRHANEIRSHRAALKVALRRGVVPLGDVLDGDDPLLATMRVQDVLMAVPGLGREKVNRALHGAMISPSRTLGGLTVRQRRDLYGRLTETPAGARAVRGGRRSS